MLICLLFQGMKESRLAEHLHELSGQQRGEPERKLECSESREEWRSAVSMKLPIEYKYLSNITEEFKW